MRGRPDERPDRAAPGGPVLPAGRLLHRPLAAGRARRHHACARRPRARRPRRTTWPRAPAEGVLRARLGATSTLQTLAYGEADRPSRRARRRCIRPATCSARRRCGSSTAAGSGSPRATTRLERATRTCAPFEPVRCHTLHHRVDLRPADLPLAAAGASCSPTINAWWRAQRRGRPRQRAARLQLRQGAAHPARASTRSIGPIVVHGAVEPLNRAYRAAGVACPTTPLVTEVDRQGADSGAPWSSRRRRRRARPGCGASASYSDAFASGWMQLRGARRRRGVDRGFVLSATTPTGRGCSSAIAATGARARDRHARLRWR